MHSAATTQLIEPVSERIGARILGLLPILFFRRESRDRALEDAKRLALLSPHLLKDLGFKYDPHSSNPITAVWRKDDVVVRVQRAERHVIVLRER
jgi:hypothetical protein